MREDKFVGSKFGKEDHLEIIGVSHYAGKHRIYNVICHICKHDKEMYGDAVFKSYRCNLQKGKIPCGCSKGFKMNQHHWYIKLSREATLLENYQDVIDFVEEKLFEFDD